MRVRPAGRSCRGCGRISRLELQRIYRVQHARAAEDPDAMAQCICSAFLWSLHIHISQFITTLWLHVSGASDVLWSLGILTSLFILILWLSASAQSSTRASISEGHHNPNPNPQFTIYTDQCSPMHLLSRPVMPPYPHFTIYYNIVTQRICSAVLWSLCILT